VTAARILAVDGGQSAIRLRHSAGGETIEVDGISRGRDTVRAVVDAVAEGWRHGGFEPVDRVVLGLTTAPADAAGCRRLAGLVAAAVGAPEVWVADDAVTAHAGALSLGWGVSVVAGTGVACLAVPENGEARIIGGHGYLLGDEGGAFWIGREGLRAALHAREGRGGPTTLAAAAEHRFGTLDDVHVRLHDDPRAVNAIAQFAPDVLEAAGAADDVAARIVTNAVRELLGVARAGVTTVGAGTGVPVALGGALLQPGTALRTRLEAVLEAEPPDPPFNVRTADGSPLDGAMALGLAGDPGRYRGLIHAWHEGTPA
jgi:glucosamine kinase